MIDPDIVKDSTEKIRAMLDARALEYDIDGLVKLDARRRETIAEADVLRSTRNRIGISISETKKRGQDASHLIRQMSEIGGDIEAKVAACDEAESTYLKMASMLPNLIDDTVPIGPDESANRKIREWTIENSASLLSSSVSASSSAAAARPDSHTPKNHVDIAASAGMGLIDTERAAKVSGARFYYLKGDMARLNYALIQYALGYITQKGYTVIQPPYMINRSSMEGAVIADDFEDVIYKVQDEDLYMIGTSEHAIAAMHSDEILDGQSLPLRYAGISPCFRKEAGAHGRDQKGIFRVHQFEKIEQFSFARPQESHAEHERMLQVAEEFYVSLGIPHRVMLLSSGDMGKVSAKTYDIEAWMAGQGAYREVVSCSNCTEYQARRLKIRFRDKTNEATAYVHTLNSTLVATTRVLVAIIENYQTSDGHITIPDALVPHMGGQKII